MHPYEDMVTDHQRILGHAQATLHDLHHCHPLPASLFKPLSRCLHAHFRIEDELVFRAVEQQSGDPQLPLTAALRREHAVMCELLSAMEADLLHDDRAAARTRLLELLDLLRKHCDREEVELYQLLWPRRRPTEHGSAVA